MSPACWLIYKTDSSSESVFVPLQGDRAAAVFNLMPLLVGVYKMFINVYKMLGVYKNFMYINIGVYKTDS